VGTALAVLQEGDQVLLNSHSAQWWDLYEMRPNKGVVLLMHEKLKPVRSKTGARDKQGAETGGAAVAQDENAPADANQQGTSATTTVAVKEYKEVRLESLVGAMVRRAGYISAKTYEGLEREAEVDFSSALMTASQYEDYVANRVPRRGKAATFSDKNIVVLFQLPCPHLADVVRHIRWLARERPRGPAGGSGGKEEVAASRDPVWHMQHQAQVQEHVQRWEQQRRARAILKQVDPYVCLHRKHWLLLSRLLRGVSNGGDALLADFVNWTKQAGADGIKRSNDCRAAWASARVATSCDLPPLASARGYLKARGAGRKAAFFDMQGRLRPEATAADPLARNILDAAASCITGRVLSFFDQGLQVPVDLDAAAQDIDACTALVPAAVYNHDCLQSLEDMQQETELGKRAHKIGTLTETRTLPCFVAVNDALLLREPVGSILEVPHDGSALRWVQVVAIDLLFARLRVVTCSAPPPHCWLPCHQQAAQALGACWIPVSKLWEVSVARALPPCSPEAAAQERECDYLVFVTPTPPVDESLALLAQLSLEFPCTPLEEQKRQLFKVYTPTPAAPEPKRAPVTAPVKAGKAAAAVCASSGRAKMAALRLYTDAVIVSWSVTLDAAKAGKAAADTSKPPPDFILEISDINSPREWLTVYRGRGLACQVSGLQGATQYRCRLRLSQSYPNVEKCYLIVTTLGAPPRLPPSVLTWEQGSVAENVRALVEVRSDYPLPPRCQWQVEGSLGGSGEEAGRGEDDEAQQKRDWLPLARTRAPTSWIVGPFAGQSLLLRARMINNEGQLGPPGASSFHHVPRLEKKAGKGAGEAAEEQGAAGAGPEPRGTKARRGKG